MSPQDVTLEEPRLLPKILDGAAKETPDRLIGMIPRSIDISKGFLEMTIKDLADAVDYMAYWIEERVGKEAFEPIAYLGVNDFRYWIMELAAIKCAHPVLLPSARNSASQNLPLFDQVKCTTLFYSHPFEARTSGLRNAGINTYVIPSFEDLINVENVRHYPYEKTWEEACLDPVVICHTSGSTGAPKPITLNNVWMRVADAERYLPSFEGHRNANLWLLEDFIWYQAFPGFHVMGVIFGICALFLEKTVAVLGPPEVPANGKTIVDLMAHVKLNFLLAAPTLCDDLIKNNSRDFIAHLGALKGVCNAGGPLSPTTGDFLSSKVDVIQMYGSTETGRLNALVPERQDWQWFEFNFGFGGLSMEKVQGTEDLYELIIKRIPGQEWCQAVFTTQPDIDVWRTRDLFRKHPSRRLYSFEGRVDDVLVLNNGEKFNPVTMEGMIQSNNFVTAALVAGQSKDQLCVILEAAGKADKDGFIDQVWPTIEKANKVSPGHARIYKHMVDVASPDKPFPRTSKGTIQRPGAVRLYAQEIEALYGDRKGAQRPPPNGMPRLQLPRESILDFVRQSVAYQLAGDEKIKDTDDFYNFGLDSLQTSQLAKSLSDAFAPHMPPLASSNITARFIYENPTIETTTEAIFAMVNGQKRADVNQMVLKQMHQMVDFYTTDLPRRTAKTVNVKKGLHVAVTGTTGFLGFYLLQVLLEDPRVERITCLNRSATAEDKFRKQSKRVRASPTEKFEFVQVSFGKPRLGMVEEVYRRLLNEIQIIIHNAWQVDFNRTLATFEDPHLIGTRTLLEWALTSPFSVELIFISSVATATYWPGYFPPNGEAEQNGTTSSLVPERPHDFSRIPSGQRGYAQSKYVAECVLTTAAKQSDLPVTIIRPGQIVDPVRRPGPTSSDTDWFPTMLETSKEMGLLPDALTHNRLIDFIPVDSLAETIIDIVHERVDEAGSKIPAIYNLVDPRPVPFAELIPTITELLSRRGNEVRPVSMQEWFDTLSSHDATDEEALTKYPSLKVLGFWEAMAESIRSPEGEDGIDTSNGCRISKTIREMKPVSGEDVVSWMNNWGI